MRSIRHFIRFNAAHLRLALAVLYAFVVLVPRSGTLEKSKVARSQTEVAAPAYGNHLQLFTREIFRSPLPAPSLSGLSPEVIAAHFCKFHDRMIDGPPVFKTGFLVVSTSPRSPPDFSLTFLS